MLSDQREDFPPLPPISSIEIENAVFTHRSLASRMAHRFEDAEGDLSPDNERYELLGDSVLGLVITTLLQEMYPRLHVGPATKIRAKLVENASLAQISLRYGLPKRLRVHPSQAISLRKSIKKQADVMEAYIGGLFKDKGLTVVSEWLTLLFKPLTVAAYENIRSEYMIHHPSNDSKLASHSMDQCGSAYGHLVYFNEILQRGSPTVEWSYNDPRQQRSRGSDSTPVWEASVLIDGVEVGRGLGNTKQGARNEAARAGLILFGFLD